MSKRIFWKDRSARFSAGSVSVSVYKGESVAKVTAWITNGSATAHVTPAVLRQLAEDFNNAANVIETGDVYECRGCGRVECECAPVSERGES